MNVTCTISTETANLRTWMTLKEMRQTRICRAFKCKGEKNDHTLHYEQVGSINETSSQS